MTATFLNWALPAAALSAHTALALATLAGIRFNR